MKAQVSISLKTIFLVLGVIALAVIGYFTVGTVFKGQNVVGKCYVSVPTEKEPEIESFLFLKGGKMIGQKYSFETEKWTDSSFSGNFEITDNRLFITSFSGNQTVSAEMKWVESEKFILIHNSDTTEYVLKGSIEDASLINSSILLGKTFVTAISNTPGYQYESLNFVEDGSIIESFYSEETKTWKDIMTEAYCIVIRNKVTIYSNDGPEIASFDIKWINKEKFKAMNEHGTFIYDLNGSKDAKVEKN